MAETKHEAPQKMKIQLLYCHIFVYPIYVSKSNVTL